MQRHPEGTRQLKVKKLAGEEQTNTTCLRFKLFSPRKRTGIGLVKGLKTGNATEDALLLHSSASFCRLKPPLLKYQRLAGTILPSPHLKNCVFLLKTAWPPAPLLSMGDPVLPPTSVVEVWP